MLFPILYKKSSTGTIQTWRIEITIDNLNNGVISTYFGHLNGKIQETKDIIKVGKNIGKVNETTPVQQAEAEAQSLWIKRLKKGYVESIDDATDGTVDTIIEGGILPMLAHKFSEHGHKIVYPAYAQPKMDGHRCIAILENGKATLWSRTRKSITGLPHIQLALEQWAVETNIRDIILDGELYNNNYRNNFEDLTSFIRTPEPKPGYQVVQYHIYDLAINNMSYVDRLSILNKAKLLDPLIAVDTTKVDDEDDLMLAFDTYLLQGYEGGIVRNISGLYTNKRSYDLQKIKEFDSDEFMVVDVGQGRGKMTGHAIFVCRTATGAEFRTKMRGSIDDLKQYWINPMLACGRLIEVQYQGITNKAGVPRFPVALRFKDLI